MGNCKGYTVVFIGLLAVGLAIAAEFTKVKSNEVIVTNSVNRYGRRYCEYPKHRDWQFAAAAAMLAFFNMKFIFYINYFAFFDYKGRNRTSKLPVTAIIYIVISGLASYSGVTTLVIGVAFSRNQANPDSLSNCRVFSNGYYISGIVLLLMACGFGVLSYGYWSGDSKQQSSKQAVEMGKATLDRPDRI